MSPRVSVVVPTFQRPALLARCLDALVTQDLPAEAYEVLVCDDAACAQTREQVERVACEVAGRGLRMRYLPNVGPHHGPAAARNLGWREGQGAVIAFTDDDCVPAENWLSAGLHALGDADGAAGKIIVPLPDTTPTDYERDVSHLEHALFVTANCFFRRSALETAGGFDERFAAAWREDSDLHFTLLELGARLITAPEAAVVHPVRTAPWGVSLRQQRKSRYNALLYKKHPALYRKHVQAAPPWRYYGIVAACMVALLALCLGAWLVAACAASVWLFQTLSFCALRLRHTARTPAHVAEMLLTSAVVPAQSVFWRLWGAVTYRVPFL
jgi:GT2 family glycosyltransferase